ncbi:unnamed protein product [Pedinophyceae sp. YPF-701]|nr:unnamed protein product [Pedinophyceae sp. YPF-701]
MLASAVRRLAGSSALLARPFSAVPAERYVEELFVGTDAKSTIIVQPRERTYGPHETLDPKEVCGADREAESMHVDHVAVVRRPFLCDGETPPSLYSAMRQVKPGHMAVDSAVCRPENQICLDVYERTAAGRFSLIDAARPLFSYFKERGIQTHLTPNVADFKAPTHDARQSTNHVLMMSPTAFTFNAEAAEDNSFMHDKVGGQLCTIEVRGKVLREYANYIHELTHNAGVDVHLFEYSTGMNTPDAVFPNNWFSTHAAEEAGGSTKERTLVLYPMKCPNRQAERRKDVIDHLLHVGKYTHVLDLSGEHAHHRYFEGTGSLVLDRPRGVAYVAISERSHEDIARRWAAQLGYHDVVLFHSTDQDGNPVYHTNVMMAVGTGVAVVCSESVADTAERENLLNHLGRHHEIVDITREQMNHLCGNVLELRNRDDLPIMAMSTQAYNAFTEEQRAAILRHTAAIHHSPVDTLEWIGGGGVRCTLGEIMMP